ncbi:MAG TPA: ABC transporter substrate-binding protein [Candidatus Angelobacter sp.]|nr:ABC transporter substrate-binding protein [Candidatus Angelobacter sp.]
MPNHKVHKGTTRGLPSCPWWFIIVVSCVALLSCARHPEPNTVVMIIEFSPTNLDPRVGTDAQSERIDSLIFDSLVRKDEHFNVQPSLAERWEIPDPQTYIFHIRHGVRFHDGRPLTAKDVKWTLDSVRDGTVITVKSGAFILINKVEAPDDFTLVIHLKEPDTPLLWSLTDGALGIVPYGSDKNFNRNPIGTGPFRFVRFDPDSQVILARNDAYWAEHPKIERVRFAIVPDATTRALELRKGSADVTAANSLPLDMVRTLRQDHNLEVQQEPGTNLLYVAFNLRDPILKNIRVRQAVAYAIDREPILHYLFADAGRLADSVLPPQHWAYNGDVDHYPHDPDKANALLDSAGYPRGKDGARFHLTMKTSSEETARLLAAVMQQQLRDVGIALDIRSFEPTTFYADVVKGAFQLYTLRWVGYTNQDPDIFEYVFYTGSFAPKRANRGYYSNPRVDKLIEEGRRTLEQERRKQIYAEVQRILAHDLPYIDFWYLDNVMVHSTKLHISRVGPSGNYDFLTTAELVR